MEGAPSSSPAYPAFTFFSAPLSPHPPSPVGKGETKVIFMQGASPLASRGLNPRGAYSPCQSGAKRGACLFCRLPTLSLAYFPAPIPLPPFPPGRGRILLYFAGGSAPGTPALNRLRHLQTLPCKHPDGGVHALSPACPAVGLFFCPHPPSPLPAGKGENNTLFRRGLRPRHPCPEPPAALIVSAKQVPSAAGSLRFGAKPIEHAFPWAVPAAKERGDRGRGTSAFEMVLSPGAGRTGAAWGQYPRRTPAPQG